MTVNYTPTIEKKTNEHREEGLGEASLIEAEC